MTLNIILDDSILLYQMICQCNLLNVPLSRSLSLSLIIWFLSFGGNIHWWYNGEREREVRYVVVLL